MKKNQIDTINDLEDEEFCKYKRDFKANFDDIIHKSFTFWDISILDQNFLGSIFSRVKTIDSSYKLSFWRPTDLKFGKSIVYVPVNFYIITETIKSINIRVKGLFNGRNVASRAQSCLNMLEYEIDERSSFIDVRNKLTENFNIFDMVLTFKTILSNYDNPIIPENFLPIIIKIVNIEDKDKRLILYHYFYISLPKFNRYILESTIYFLYILYNDKLDKHDIISMEGIATIIMPHLVLKHSKHLSLEHISKLVVLIKEFILNFEEISAQRKTN